MADKGLRELLTIGRDAQAAWPWKAHDLAPTLLAPGAIVTAIQHELYRVGARPLLGGGQDRLGAGVHFPGGKSPRIELAGLPGKIKPLVAVMAEAAELASQIMRTGKSTADVPASAAAPSEPAPLVTEQDQRTPAQARLGALLQRQTELAADPAASDDEYRTVVEQIVAAQAAVDLEIGART